MSGQHDVARYVRVRHDSLFHPKLAGLTAEERGWWIVGLCLGAIAYPKPVHVNAVALVVGGTVTPDRLYERELWDACEDDGWFFVHNLEESRVRPSDTPEATRARKAKSRAVTDVTTVTDVTKVTPTKTRRTKTRRDSESDSMTVVYPREHTRRSAANVRGFKRPFEKEDPA